MSDHPIHRDGTDHHDDEGDARFHRGLQADVAAIVDRRRFLRWTAGVAGAVAVGGAAVRHLARATPAYADSSCTTIPSETAGPYPGDGSNGVNVLTRSGIVRSDIRSSFGTSTATVSGVPLTISLTLLDTSGSSCAPVVGAAVYLWHCDAQGRYSLYSSGVTNETWLRGVQVSDASGQVTFTTIFPGCYSGRWPHVHFEVYPDLASTSSASNKVAVSQLALPETTCDEVYATTGYSSSVSNLNGITLGSDNVFRDDLAAHQMATITGTVSGGLAATLLVGVSGGSTGGTGGTTSSSLTVTPTASPTTVGAPSAYVPLAAPTRLLDTRAAYQIGYSGSKPAAGATVTLPVLGRNGIPASGVSAVVLNVTGTEATAAGYVTVWPESTMPTASSLNLESAGQTRANLVTVPVGADGSVRLYTQTGTHLVADAFGWFAPAASSASGRLQFLTPGRVLDTRSGSQTGYSGSKPGAGSTVTLALAGRGGLPSSGTSAVVLNVTVTESTAAGYVTVWPDGTQPTTSNLNVSGAGETIANQVVVPLGADGSVRLFTNAGAHLVADVTGYYTGDATASGTSGLFVPVSPYRAVDTRTIAKLAAGGTLALMAAATGTAAAGRAGLATNVTVTEATAAGYVTVWPDGTRPIVSSLNATGAGQTVANHVLTSVASDGGVRLFAQSGAHLVVDVTGWYVA